MTTIVSCNDHVHCYFSGSKSSKRFITCSEIKKYGTVGSKGYTWLTFWFDKNVEGTLLITDDINMPSNKDGYYIFVIDKTLFALFVSLQIQINERHSHHCELNYRIFGSNKCNVSLYPCEDNRKSKCKYRDPCINCHIFGEKNENINIILHKTNIHFSYHFSNKIIRLECSDLDTISSKEYCNNCSIVNPKIRNPPFDTPGFTIVDDGCVARKHSFPVDKYSRYDDHDRLIIQDESVHAVSMDQTAIVKSKIINISLYGHMIIEDMVMESANITIIRGLGKRFRNYSDPIQVSVKDRNAGYPKLIIKNCVFDDLCINDVLENFEMINVTVNKSLKITAHEKNRDDINLSNPIKLSPLCNLTLVNIYVSLIECELMNVSIAPAVGTRLDRVFIKYDNRYGTIDLSSVKCNSFIIRTNVCSVTFPSVVGSIIDMKMINRKERRSKRPNIWPADTIIHISREINVDTLIIHAQCQLIYKIDFTNVKARNIDIDLSRNHLYFIDITNFITDSEIINIDLSNNVLSEIKPDRSIIEQSNKRINIDMNSFPLRLTDQFDEQYIHRIRKFDELIIDDRFQNDSLKLCGRTINRLKIVKTIKSLTIYRCKIGFLQFSIDSIEELAIRDSKINQSNYPPGLGLALVAKLKVGLLQDE